MPQILFSGVLFPFERGITTTRVLSWFTVSRSPNQVTENTANTASVITSCIALSMAGS